MSLIRSSRSAPAWWIVQANSICFSVRFPSAFSASSFARMSSELSGVRSSWLMFARNSLLYFDESASCSARSCSAVRASSISRFLISMRRFCSSSSCAFSSSSSFVCWSSSCCVCSSSSDALSVCACCSSSTFARFSSSCCDCSSSERSCSSSVRRLRLAEQLLRPHRRLDRVDDDADRLAELVEEAALHLAERLERRELDHRHHLVLEEHRHDDDVLRRRLAEAGGDLHVVLRRLADQDRLLLERRLADERLAELVAVRHLLARLVAVARDQLQRAARLVAPPRGRTRRSRRRRAASART